MAIEDRDTEPSDRMSEHEALMWNVGKDPWLNPNGASLTLLDQPVDIERFRRQLRYGVSIMPRLYQRVVPGLGRLSTPAWVPDPEFDFDHHVREVELPSPGTERQLLDLAARLYEEPLDRTRPLWRFVAIRGLEGGRGAVWSVTHHAIADGVGQVRMAEIYQQLNREDEPPPEVDLEAVVADAIERYGAKESGGDLATSLASTTARTVGHLARRQAGVSRRVLGELMLWPADPSRIGDRVGDVVATARSTAGLLAGSDNGTTETPSLWQSRSRHRRLEYVQVPLEGLKTAANALGGSVNDAFLIGMTEAAIRYHGERDVVVDTFSTSFVVSTRTDNARTGNSFTPVLLQVSGQPAPFESRMAEVHVAANDARKVSDRSGGIAGLSGVINLLPTSVVTRTARKQAAAIDFATSNLRGAPFALYCAGARVEAIVCMGPVAGTAANATGMSYDGVFTIGLFIDPKAIEDGVAYRRCVESSFADLLAAPVVSPAEEGLLDQQAVVKATAVRTKKRPARKSTKGPGAKKAGGAAKAQAAKKRPASKKPASKRTKATS